MILEELSDRGTPKNSPPRPSKSRELTSVASYREGPPRVSSAPDSQLFSL